MTITAPAIILATGTAVLAILFGARLAIRSTAKNAGAPRTGGEVSTTAGSEASDVAGVIALPPLIFLAFLVAATVLEALVPLPVLAAYPLARFLVGAALAVCGVVLIAMGTSRFVAAGTNIPPNLPTTALVIDCIYERTRNPLYLGAILIYLALGVAAGSLWAIILVVLLFWVINVGVIAWEERYLERKFGDAYRAYKGRVRRWV
jgi:protein-S-isoprenylcysteine O-methyltransferase Ste14